MNALRSIIPALCLTAVAVGGAAYARAEASDGNTTSNGGAAAAAPHGSWGRHSHRRADEFRHALHQLNLTTEQQAQIKSIVAQSKQQHQALFDTMRQNHQALAATMPGDPNYPSLIATAQNNASARIQAMSELKTAIYAVLTPAQQAQLPAIVAADQAAHAARAAKWRAEHSAS